MLFICVYCIFAQCLLDGTVFELWVTEVEILAGSNWIFFGSLRFLDALQVLPHCVDRAVHVQQFRVQVFLRVLRFHTENIQIFGKNPKLTLIDN